MVSGSDVKFCLLSVVLYLITVQIPFSQSVECGCKKLRPCYYNMLKTLLDRDEVPCIEDAAIGLSTLTVFLKALHVYCPGLIEVQRGPMTFEGRSLYEVQLHNAMDNELRQSKEDEVKPIIIIDAGQEGGSESVMLALYVIEQLLACEEYDAMIQTVRWIILPCTNPDGQEYSRFSRIPWRKNLRPSNEDASFGVDLTRNFDAQWGACAKVDCGFSQLYPGPQANSENETMFVKDVLTKYKDNTKLYLSIKRDGHSINYPFAYSTNAPTNLELLSKIAGEVSVRVNQRAGGVHSFSNNSIVASEGKPHCGHSVDFAHGLGIPLAYEMRVFLGSDNRIMSKFQSMPRGYETSLRNGYFSGIRELYNVIKNEKKYGKLKQ